ncbi:hypothetical protein [Burkholderia sp. 22313]|uniref:hypothetical protein n=1 Tax=Burkholderia sp. 22313 TaxID=3453908 RepID=UPI003F87C8C2
MQISYEAERAAGQRADHLEALIDEAGAESFPASDPPAVHPEPRPVTTTVTTVIDSAEDPS